MKKSTYYFSHDYNASNDFKILFLRQKYGMLGCGIYWYIIESLAQADGFLPLNTIPILAMQMQVEENIVRSIIYDFELFVPRETTFHSERLLNHLSIRKNLSEKGKEGAVKRWGNRGAIGNPNGKEIKENEINSIHRIKIE